MFENIKYIIDLIIKELSNNDKIILIMEEFVLVCHILTFSSLATFGINLFSKINNKKYFLWNKVYTPSYFIAIYMLIFCEGGFRQIPDKPTTFTICLGMILFSFIYYHYFFDIFFYEGDERDHLIFPQKFGSDGEKKLHRTFFNFLFKNNKDIKDGIFVLDYTLEFGFVLITFLFMNVGFYFQVPFYFVWAFSTLAFTQLVFTEHYYNFYVKNIKKMTVQQMVDKSEKEFQEELEEDRILREKKEEMLQNGGYKRRKQIRRLIALIILIYFILLALNVF